MKNYNKAYFDWMYETQGLLPEEIGCEECGRMSGTIFDRHHLFFKSEKGYHPEINNPRNIAQLCRDCHNRFHADKSLRDPYIEKRNLNELFI